MEFGEIFDYRGIDGIEIEKVGGNVLRLRWKIIVLRSETWLGKLSLDRGY